MSAGVMALTSCFNKDYDLSDIDTNVRIPMNDLVIPLNMSAITLESVLDLDEDDPDERIKRAEAFFSDPKIHIVDGQKIGNGTAIVEDSKT